MGLSQVAVITFTYATLKHFCLLHLIPDSPVLVLVDVGRWLCCSCCYAFV